MKSPNLIILGAPGSGKGTRAAALEEILGVPQISTGDIFRANICAGTKIGERVKRIIDRGELVPDDVVDEMVRSRLSEEDCRNGFILDGFPRTLPQAAALDAMMRDFSKEIAAVIQLEISDEEVVKRISGRRLCSKCQASYHVSLNPPKLENHCDKCSGELFVREDDKPETVLKRLKVYSERTFPLIEYYDAKGLLVRVKSEISESGLRADMEKLVREIGLKPKA